MRRIGALLLGVALMGAACSGDDDGATPATTTTGSGIGGVPVVAIDDLQFVSRLTPLGDCDAVLAHLREQALARVGPYGLDGHGGWYGPFGGRGDMFASEETGGGDVAEGDGGTGAPTPSTVASSDEFSGTNTAETGVDEADIVKTDGERIYTVHEGRLAPRLEDLPAAGEEVELPGLEMLGTQTEDQPQPPAGGRSETGVGEGRCQGRQADLLESVEAGKLGRVDAFGHGDLGHRGRKLPGGSGRVARLDGPHTGAALQQGVDDGMIGRPER